MMRNVYCGSRIQGPAFLLSSRIQGSKRSTGSRIRIHNTGCAEVEDFPLYFTNVDDCCGAGCVTRCFGGALCACPASPLTTPTWKPRGATRPLGCPPLTPVSHFVVFSSYLPCSYRFLTSSRYRRGFLQFLHLPRLLL
jgi:hypothetical protein